MYRRKGAWHMTMKDPTVFAPLVVPILLEPDDEIPEEYDEEEDDSDE